LLNGIKNKSTTSSERRLEMGRLHEILAVEKDAAQKCTKILTESKDTFSKRQDHFAGFTKKYSAFNEEERKEEDALTESKEIVTTVMKKLSYTLDSVKDMVDVKFQKDMANKSACADIIIDGSVLISNVPAVTLLMLEDSLKEVRAVIDTVPTLEPGVKWVADSALGEGIFATERPETRIRTRKENVWKEVVKATDKFPAQVAQEARDIAVGKYEETKYSSRISPAQKMTLLNNVEKLSRAVKQARARANEQEVPSICIGGALMSFILNG